MHLKPKLFAYLLLVVVLVAVLVVGLNRIPPEDPTQEEASSKAADSSPRIRSAHPKSPPNSDKVATNQPEGSFDSLTSNDDPLPLDILVSEKLPPDLHPHNLGTWLGAFEPPPSQWEKLRTSQSEVISFNLRTPDGVDHEVAFGRFTKIGTSKGIYSGAIKGSPFSEAMISFVGDAIVGSMRLPGQGIGWEVRNQGSGVQKFEKVDLAKLPACAACRHE
ncbi:hypothetical protein [Pelagicoccus sp. SDUM812002]|uniref:hypothetical protein n=1 Tax=Pelagicoccus sp. SDUM812002 TaxID=3041266 RepID=UPI00280DEE33|nr:hypothetical protein [Pelagicoccus sp. SDUM812002]MDQ8184726.1 hypothetical protein [Pelagicoccus sp. SDUM812002]